MKSSSSKINLPPGNLSFLFNIRKRSQKAREKESEDSKDNKISKSLIEKIHKNKQDLFRMPQPKMSKKALERKQEKTNKSLEALIFKKFHNRKSVSKILQKTAQLQKSVDRKILEESYQNEERDDALRHSMLKRIKCLQTVRSDTYTKKERVRGPVETRYMKLRYQSPKQKRKTRNFKLFSLEQLDFPDANNLLKKRLFEYEFDNDIDSDHDEITKTCYVRLKDLTVSLKEQLRMGEMYDNDEDDLAIKEHVGYSA